VRLLGSNISEVFMYFKTTRLEHFWLHGTSVQSRAIYTLHVEGVVGERKEIISWRQFLYFTHSENSSYQQFRTLLTMNYMTPEKTLRQIRPSINVVEEVSYDDYLLHWDSYTRQQAYILKLQNYQQKSLRRRRVGRRVSFHSALYQPATTSTSDGGSGGAVE
jgi:hypothetical protein